MKLNENGMELAPYKFGIRQSHFTFLYLQKTTSRNGLIGTKPAGRALLKSPQNQPRSVDGLLLNHARVEVNRKAAGRHRETPLWEADVVSMDVDCTS
jgi:hypothetical protein